MCAPTGDMVTISTEARTAYQATLPQAAAAQKRPGLLVGAAGLVLDALTACLIAWGEWWDGTSPEQVERHGG